LLTTYPTVILSEAKDLIAASTASVFVPAMRSFAALRTTGKSLTEACVVYD
jgi:hypothetical protein